MVELDLRQPRSIWEIFSAALRTYQRFPVLFLTLSLILEVPVQVLVAILSNEKHGASTSAALIALLIEFVLVSPTMAVLQAQAVLILGEGRTPTLNEALKLALPVLPAAIAAEIIAGIGIGVGLFLFILPGILLLLRWAVVAQAAAIERTDWPTAIRRSTQLTRRNSLRVLAVLLLGVLFSEIPTQVANTSNGLGPTIVSIALLVLVAPLVSLLTTYLYFDLRAREALD